MIISWILGVVLICCIFVIINLLRKVEKLEDISTKEYENALVIILFMQDKIQKAYDEMHRIDKRGGFKADDEVGHVFKQIYFVIEKLNESINRIRSEESGETK